MFKQLQPRYVILKSLQKHENKKCHLFKYKGCTGIQVQWNKELSEKYITVLARGRNSTKWNVPPGETPSEMSVNCTEKILLNQGCALNQ